MDPKQPPRASEPLPLQLLKKKKKAPQMPPSLQGLQMAIGAKPPLG
jgi:hypothetical protein